MLTSQHRFTTYQSCARIFGDHARVFYLSVFFYRSSNIKVCLWQRLRVDGDLFENAPRVDADTFCTDKDAFSKISEYVWTGPKFFG